MPDLDVLPFEEKWPWRGADLQTLRNTFLGDNTDLSPWPAERLVIDAGDNSGDRLVVAAHMVPDSTRPTVILIHGLTGCEDSYYLRRSALYFLRHGYPVIRMNMRGAAPARKFANEEYHSGRSGDIGALVKGLDRRWTANGLVAFGYSLGGNILLKYMGEQGEAAPFLLAASISAPIDLSLTSARFREPRNKLYHHWMLQQVKEWVRHDNLDRATRDRIDDAASMYDFDGQYIAWRYGFASADDYHQRSSALGYLGGIKKPVLAIHAADDPWIPTDMYHRAEQLNVPAIDINIVGGGGHLGFHDSKSDGTWHDRRLTGFLQEHGL